MPLRISMDKTRYNYKSDFTEACINIRTIHVCIIREIIGYIRLFRRRKGKVLTKAKNIGKNIRKNTMKMAINKNDRMIVYTLQLPINEDKGYVHHTLNMLKAHILEQK